MSRILHSFCIEMPAPGGKLERITSIFFPMLPLSKVLRYWFLATIKVAFKFKVILFSQVLVTCKNAHEMWGCLLMSLCTKAGCVWFLFGNPYRKLPHYVLHICGWCLKNHERFNPAAKIYTCSPLENSKSYISREDIPYPNWGVQRENTTDWYWTTTTENIYIEIFFLKIQWPKWMFWKALQQASSPKELHSRCTLLQYFSFIINFYSS